MVICNFSILSCRFLKFFYAPEYFLTVLCDQYIDSNPNQIYW